MRSKRYILIIIAILLLTQIIRIYNFWVNYANGQPFSFEILITEERKDCQFSFQKMSFKLKNCHNYQTGSSIGLIGRVMGVTDSELQKPKKLNVTVIDIRKNLVTSGLSWMIKKMQTIAVVRDSVIESLMGYLPNASLVLIIDMAFGQIVDLPNSIYHQLKTIGMLHVTAASGYNVAFVSASLLRLSARFRGVYKAYIWLTGMTFYFLISDQSISIIRAYVMFALVLIAKRFGRFYHNLFSLATAVFLLLIWRPELLGDLSFQLSVSATFGIITFANFFEKRLVRLFNIFGHRHVFTNWLAEALAVSLAAQLITTPILLANFGEVTLLAFISNIFLLWLTPLLTMFGVLLMIVGWLSLYLNSLEIVLKIIAPIGWFASQSFIEISAWLSGLGFMNLKINKEHWTIVVFSLFIISLMLYKENQNEKKIVYFLNSCLDKLS